MLRDTIKQIIKTEILKAQKLGLLVKPLGLEGKIELPEIEIERPEEEVFGDYCANIAMKMTKVFKKPSMEIAQILVNQLIDSSSARKIFSKIEAREPGFINFFLSEDYLTEQLKEILSVKRKFGDLALDKSLLRQGFGGPREKVQVEFISANPTGPLTLGNGRGAFLGDVLANVLKKAGYRVGREYYINNVGEQILQLGHSVLGDEQAVYHGDYIDSLKSKIKEVDAKKAGEKAAKIILNEMIKPLIEKKLKIKFDRWFSEKTLHQSGEVDKILAELKKNDLAYDKEGAFWFKSTLYGDDKDRVLIKSVPDGRQASGEKTYLASDIAYLKNKFQRGFKKIIYIWGADHFGYIQRIKAAAQALGHSAEDVQFIIMQLVRLIEGGKEIRMSKRRGVFVLLEELIDEVGLDAARFFFLIRAADSHLNFDLALAKEQSEKNPVYYVQYAYARMNSILAKAKIKSRGLKADFKLLSHSSELALLKKMLKFPEIIADTAKDYQVQRLPQYALDLVTSFHKFYEDCRVIPARNAGGSENKNLTQARLSLVEAMRIVLKNILDLMGITAPEKM